jgi:hypothetical protein
MPNSGLSFGWFRSYCLDQAKDDWTNQSNATYLSTWKSKSKGEIFLVLN